MTAIADGPLSGCQAYVFGSSARRMFYFPAPGWEVRTAWLPFATFDERGPLNTLLYTCYDQNILLVILKSILKFQNGFQNDIALKSREGSSGLPARKYFYRPLSGRTVSIWVAKPDRRRIFNVPAYGGTWREDMPLIGILYT